MAAHQRVGDVVLQDDDVDGGRVVGHADPVRAGPEISTKFQGKSKMETFKSESDRYGWEPRHYIQ